jgi:hypothetical protein
MDESPRFQAKQISQCGEKTCHFPHDRVTQFNRHSGESRNPEKMGLDILDAGSSPA